MLYTVHVRDNAAGEADAYIPIYFNNILLNADGSNYVDISTIEISNSSFNIDTVYNSNINAKFVNNQIFFYNRNGGRNYNSKNRFSIYCNRTYEN